MKPAPGPLVEGPTAFLWAQYLGFAIGIVLLASVLLSWGLALDTTVAPCQEAQCFPWTGYWIDPALGALHLVLGGLMVAGGSALRRGLSWGTWCFILPDVYLILYGAVWTLFGIVYWEFGEGWLLGPGMVLPFAIAHLTCAVHPNTRKFLRRQEERRAARAAEAAKA